MGLSEKHRIQSQKEKTLVQTTKFVVGFFACMMIIGLLLGLQIKDDPRLGPGTCFVTAANTDWVIYRNNSDRDNNQLTLSLTNPKKPLKFLEFWNVNIRLMLEQNGDKVAVSYGDGSILGTNKVEVYSLQRNIRLLQIMPYNQNIEMRSFKEGRLNVVLRNVKNITEVAWNAWDTANDTLHSSLLPTEPPFARTNITLSQPQIEVVMTHDKDCKRVLPS